MPATPTKSSNTSKPQPSPAVDGRCQHLRADGKRCAQATYPGHASLCHYHLTQQMRGVSDADAVAADILSSVGNFQSANAINVVLGKLFIHQITGRISRKDAMALANTCQLLLQTLPGVKAEIQEAGYLKSWREETNRIVAGEPDLASVTAPSLLPQSPQPLWPRKRTPNPAPATPTTPAPSQTSSAHPSPAKLQTAGMPTPPMPSQTPPALSSA